MNGWEGASEWVSVCVFVCERERVKLRVWNLLVSTRESNGWKQISGHRCNTSIRAAKMCYFITIYLHMFITQTGQLILYVCQVIWAGTWGTRLNRIPKSRSPARTQPAQLQTATLIPSLHLSPCFIDVAPSLAPPFILKAHSRFSVNESDKFRLSK